MIGVVDNHDGGLPGGESRNLHGVLDGLGTTVQQHGGLGEIAGGELRELLADFDVLLVGRHHETGVGEVRDLATHGLGHGGNGVTNRGDRNTRAHVENLVAIDVGQNGAFGRRDVDRETLRQTRGDDLLATLVQGLGLRSGQFREQLAAGGGVSHRHGGLLEEVPLSVVCRFGGVEGSARGGEVLGEALEQGAIGLQRGRGHGGIFAEVIPIAHAQGGGVSGVLLEALTFLGRE